MNSVDFEISDADGKTVVEGSVPYMVVEKDIPEEIIEGFGVMYRIPARHVTKVVFTNKMPAIESGQTLTLFGVPEIARR